MRSKLQLSAPALPGISTFSPVRGPTTTRLASTDPRRPPSNSTSADAQSSFSTSTRSSDATRLKCVPSPVWRGRCGISVAVRPLRRAIGPTRLWVRSTTWAIRSPSAPEPAAVRWKRQEAAASGRLA